MGNTNKRTPASTSEGSWLTGDRPSSRQLARQRPRSQAAAPKQPQEQQPQVESHRQPVEQQPQVESLQQLVEQQLQVESHQPEEQQPQMESQHQPEEQPQMESHQQPEEQQTKEQQTKEEQEKSSPAEKEGTLALLLESGKEEKMQKEEKPSPSQRELGVVDPALLAEISGFVYHEPDLVLHIRRSLGELQAIAKTIDSTKKNIRESTDDLVVTYNKTTNLFRQRGPDDETVEKAINKLEENVNLQDTVTEGFLSAADSIHSSVSKLSTQIDRMTSVVFSKIPESMLIPESPSSDTP